MASNEPINLREWRPPAGRALPGKLFTCGRPGRATYGRAKVRVPDNVIDEWAQSLPDAVILHIISLLGEKTTGLSEFSCYPFRSETESGTKPTFQAWLNARYDRRFVIHEFPTIDGRGIEPSRLGAASNCIAECLRDDLTTLVMDSAGAERTARVCEALGYTCGTLR